MFSDLRILLFLIIKSLFIACVLNLEIKTSEDLIRLKRQSTGTVSPFPGDEYGVSNPEKQPAHPFETRTSDDNLVSEDTTNGTMIVNGNSNKNVPIFDKPVYIASISEGVTGGHLVTTVHATDADSGTTGQINYRFSNVGSGYNNFEINNASGEIRVAKNVRIDREKRNSYTLVALAIDKGLVPLTGSVEVKINVQDINDNAPQFVNDKIIVLAPENLNIGSTVAVIDAVDPDEGLNAIITYSFEGGLDSDLFLLKSQPGGPAIIVNRVELDFESDKKDYYILLKASSGTLFSQALVIIKVQDVNDNTPTFEQAFYKVEMYENFPVSSVVTTVRATDRDSGKNQAIRYRIIVPTVSLAFRIDPISGTISTLKVLDREVQATYQLTIQATDQANFGKQLSSTTVIEIKLLDENDNYPQFEKTSFTANVSEVSAISSQIARVTANDVDEGRNQEIVYSIIDGDAGGNFGINSSSGEVILRKSLDYEVRNHYILRIKASDSGQLPKANVTTLDINVIDNNDNAPVFQQNDYTAIVQENALHGTSVLSVLAYDADSGLNSQLRYSISNDSLGFPFTIDAKQGKIFVTATLDREKQSDYSFTVVARDYGIPSLTSTTLVDIRVQDINDNPPIFQRNKYIARIQENVNIGTSVLTVKALDLDSGVNGKLDYVISHVSPSTKFPFAIDSTRGSIFITSQLDREEQDSYLFVVKARDHGVPQLSSTATVEVKILDVNDNSPVFSLKHMFIDIPYDAPLGQYVTRLTATDADLVYNARIIYAISGGNHGQFFSLDNQTGLITLEKPLNHTNRTSFILTVSANDGFHFDTSEVHINVTHINNHALFFLNKTYQFMVYEEEPAGTTVGVVQAIYTDVAPVSGNISYELIETQGEFSIDPATGEIRTQFILDREIQSSYLFKVRAITSGAPTCVATAEISVCVVDINDNYPYFYKMIHEAFIRKPVAAGQLVTIVQATDIDSGINSQITYSLKAANDIHHDFNINSINGSIYISPSNTINEETTRNYTLTVLAVDGGVVPLTVQTLVAIKVEADIIPVG